MLRVWDGRDWGAARLIRRDALSLVRFLTERVASDADLRNRIAADPTISADVRSLALALSRDFWEARVRAHAKDLIRPLYTRLLLRADILRPPDLRPQSLFRFETYPP